MQYAKAGIMGDAGIGHTGGVAALSFSPNGTVIASAGLDAKVCIWKVSDGTLLHVFVGASPVLSLVWVKNGVLLCGAEDGSISVITTSTSKLHGRTFPRRHTYPVEHLAVRDARCVVSGAHAEAAVWDMSSEGHWKHMHDLPPPPSNSNNKNRDIIVSSVHWTRSKDKTRLLFITYLYHGYILYDTKTWRSVLTIPMNGLIAHACVSPNGKRFVVSNMTSGFDVYETETGRSVGAINHPVAKLLAVPVSFAHNGAVIIGGSAVGEAHIWDATTRHLRQSLFLGDSKYVIALAVHHDRTQDRFYIATGLSNPVAEQAITLWYADGRGRASSRCPWRISRPMYVTLYVLLGMSAALSAIVLGMHIADAPVLRQRA
ncbi:WD40-repeat-containing domain protein [Cerioporus squamosus]|nr:WD40-repeat-containing domain protein [Cerioporus squamosus]